MALLKHEFPDVLVAHIKTILQQQKSVYKAYLELCKNPDVRNRKTKQSRKPAPQFASLDPLAQVVHSEVNRGRVEGEKFLEERQVQQRSVQLEAANEAEARRLGQMGEWYVQW